MAAASASAIGVVFSVHQTDVIFYGEDLLDYVKHEFGPKDASRPGSPGIPSTVLPPWSLLAAGVEVE